MTEVRHASVANPPAQHTLIVKADRLGVERFIRFVGHIPGQPLPPVAMRLDRGSEVQPTGRTVVRSACSRSHAPRRRHCLRTAYAASDPIEKPHDTPHAFEPG
ncbi:hypothetical protein SDC9_146339 [bioreactor metagenome]|uniref:Uncharacterized protein n=1 Tax=bioreactor metagenome TaxID=1076179 RepID=A0A645EDG1_9ZZZZ